jgi:putative spermidine/putrescine transport system substrate-binding protein
LKKAILAAAVTLGLASAAAAQTPTLVVSTYGIAQQQFQDLLFTPFEKANGCKVVVEAGNNADRIAKLKADPSKYDLAVFADFGAKEAADAGLVQPIDVSKLSNYGKLYESAKDPLGGHLAVGYTIYSTSIVYRTDKLPPVKSWNDLFSKDVKGRVAIPNITTTQGPVALLMIGKAMGNTDPSFVEPIKRLGQVKDDVVTFYERSPQLVTLFAQDEVLMAPVGRFAWGNLVKTGKPLAWALPQEGQAGGMNVMTVVKGSKNLDLVYKLMDTWLSTEVQTKLAAALVDSPANKEVQLDAKTADLMTYGREQIEAIQFLPPEAILKHRESWITNWNKSIAQ